MTFKIETGVPIPPTKNNRYKWEDMKAGDSFFVPFAADDDTTAAKASLRTSIGHSARRIGVKVTTRILTDGIRVWRLK